MNKNREPNKQPENVSPESSDRNMGPAQHSESEQHGGRWGGNLSHSQSDSHTDPAIPSMSEAESVSTSKAEEEDPAIRTKRFRDAA